MPSRVIRVTAGAVMGSGAPGCAPVAEAVGGAGGAEGVAATGGVAGTVTTGEAGPPGAAAVAGGPAASEGEVAVVDDVVPSTQAGSARREMAARPRRSRLEVGRMRDLSHGGRALAIALVHVTVKTAMSGVAKVRIGSSVVPTPRETNRVRSASR